jgi:internalin A
VTDAGLKELTTLKSLRTVSLTKTRVTEAGVRKFKEALPDCRVIHDKWGDPPSK